MADAVPLLALTVRTFDDQIGLLSHRPGAADGLGPRLRAVHRPSAGRPSILASPPGGRLLDVDGRFSASGAENQFPFAI